MKKYVWPHTDFFFLLWRCDPTRVMASSFLRFLDHTQRRTTIGRTPLDLWSARRRDLYLTTHNTHNRQISMPPEGFEPTISARERPQTYALDRAATGTGNHKQYFPKKKCPPTYRTDVHFHFCSWVYMKVSPWNSVLKPTLGSGMTMDLCVELKW